MPVDTPCIEGVAAIEDHSDEGLSDTMTGCWAHGILGPVTRGARGSDSGRGTAFCTGNEGEGWMDRLNIALKQVSC